MAIQQEPTPDISPETLGALSALMLAQAQEIFVYKAIHDSMKDGIVARLAAQAEELYADALKLFQKEIFRAFWDKEWVPLVSTSGKYYYIIIYTILYYKYILLSIYCIHIITIK